MFEGIVGNTGLCSLEISRSTKGDYSYTLKTYFSAKGPAPEAAIHRADRLRRDVERRLGLLAEAEAGEDVELTFPDFAAVHNELCKRGHVDLAVQLTDIFMPTPPEVVEAREKKRKENHKKSAAKDTDGAKDQKDPK